MELKRQVRKRAVLKYPSHWFEPEELLSFIELKPFTRRWDDNGLTDEDLEALQVVMMTRPKAGDIIEDTGGLRKLRFSPPDWNVGKSGATRICYAYFEEVGTIILAIVYKKGEKDDLNKGEKKIIRTAIERIKKSLLCRSYRCSLSK